ncbi:MAG: hypothetical protein FJ267_18635 [Planctomycetes bacterium]|nr:hypothetical protein [Planctomycetota bacterium]
MVQWNPGINSRVSTLETERGRPTPISTVRESLIRHLTDEFDYQNYQLITGHPLLQRTTRKVYVFR